MSANSPHEIELKFQLDAAAVSHLRRALAARLGDEGKVSRLVSTYYDTPDHRLQAAGVTLRVRTDGPDALVQTVKRSHDPASALLDREEWETALTTPEPDFAAFAATPAGARLAVRTLTLEPLFDTVVDRCVWAVVREGCRVEVALDRGHVTAGARIEALAELELELKEGAPRHLFELVRELGEIGGLRPGVMTKSDRGFRVARGTPDRASKADPPRVVPHMSAGDAFGIIVHASLRHFGLNASLVEDRRAPDALHQARVALRRLRSALSLFKPVVADADHAELTAALQDLSQVLGRARDLDVHLSRHVQGADGPPQDGSGRALYLAEIERRRLVAYDHVVARLRSPACGALLLRLVEWTEAGRWRTDADPRRSKARERPVRRFAAGMLRKRRRRVLRRGRDLAGLDPEARHRVRIAAKKLRYAAEFFAGLARRPKAVRRHRRFVAALEGLQDTLGTLNDIKTGQDLAASVLADVRARDGAAAEARVATFLASDPRASRTGPLLQVAETAHARLADTRVFWTTWRD